MARRLDLSDCAKSRCGEKIKCAAGSRPAGNRHRASWTMSWETPGAAIPVWRRRKGRICPLGEVNHYNTDTRGLRRREDFIFDPYAVMPARWIEVLVGAVSRTAPGGLQAECRNIGSLR